MAEFPTAVSPPGGMSYAAPLLNFQNFSNWAADSTLDQQSQRLNQQRIQQGQQRLDLTKALQGGAALDAQGNFDPQKAAAILAKFGDIDAVAQLTPLIQQQQAGNTPAWPQGGQAGAAPAAAQPASIPARPLPPPAANSPQGDPGTGTIADIVTARMPAEDLTTGQTIGKIAKLIGVDPNATLTAGQRLRAEGLLRKYAGSDTAPAAVGGDGGGAGAPLTFKDRLAGDGGGALPPSAIASSPAPSAAPAGTPPAQPQPAPSAGPGAPQAPGQPQPPQGGPLVPQVPLPPGFTDPQQAILALNRRAGQLESQNPRLKPKADELRDWASRIAESIKPLAVGPMTTYVDPRNSQPIYQGPSAALMSGAAGRSGSLESDAEIYRQTGKLPANIGRGIQGNAESAAIREAARQQEIADGGNPADWPSRWQKFSTQAAGLRTLENRAAGLTLAENEAKRLIPRVREISALVSKTEFPSINKLILAAKKGTGDPNVIKLGVAIESLIPVYAKVLKPTGTVGKADMETAHDIVDKAWSNGQINAALDQMEVELDSAKAALKDTQKEYGSREKKGSGDVAPPASSSRVSPSGINWSVE